MRPRACHVARALRGEHKRAGQGLAWRKSADYSEEELQSEMRSDRKEWQTADPARSPRAMIQAQGSSHRSRISTTSLKTSRPKEPSRDASRAIFPLDLGTHKHGTSHFSFPPLLLLSRPSDPVNALFSKRRRACLGAGVIVARFVSGDELGEARVCARCPIGRARLCDFQEQRSRLQGSRAFLGR